MAVNVGIAWSGLLLLLLLVGAVVVAVVVLLVAGGRKTRLTGGGILAGLGMVAVLGMGLFGVRLLAPVRREVAVPAQHRSSPDSRTLPPRRPDDPGMWIEADSAEFLADVYPSARQAARALAAQAAARLSQMAEEGKGPSIVEVAMTGRRSSDQAVTDAVVEILGKKSRPGGQAVAATTQPARPGPPADGTARVEVAVEAGPVRRVSGMSGQEETGDVTVRLLTGGRTETFTTTYVTKQWMDNFALFASRDNRIWILGRCDRPCATAEEAQRQAMAHVGEAVLEHVRKAGATLGPRVEANGTEWMREQAAAIAQRRGMIRDQFVQSFRRPYGGTLWQHAVLVNPQGGDLPMVSHEIQMAAGARRATWAWVGLSRVLSVGVVLLAILLAYAFINAATKGYYVWALRIAAGVLVAGGVLLVLAIS